MTSREHAHEDLATKVEVAEFKVIIADAIVTLTNNNLALNSRIDKLEADVQKVLVTLQELVETNRRGFGFQTSNDWCKPLTALPSTRVT